MNYVHDVEFFDTHHSMLCCMSNITSPSTSTSGAARGGGTQGARAPHDMSGAHRTGISTFFFLQNFTKKRFIIFSK